MAFQINQSFYVYLFRLLISFMHEQRGRREGVTETLCPLYDMSNITTLHF